jgi:hypothetical protein
MTSAISRVCLGACIVASMPAPAGAQARGSANPPERVLEAQRFYLNGQELRLSTNDPLTGPLVTDAPFSADAATTVTQTLGDGTRIEQSTTARFYRDRAGRVRREQTILGLGNLNRGDGAQTITILTDPATRAAYTLDPTARTARRTPPVGWTMAFGTNVTAAYVAGATVVLPAGRTGGARSGGANQPTEESLGTRQIEGLKAVGRKTTAIIPAGQIGNDRPIEITDERWESPELRMLIFSRSSDPRTGVVEYRLTNISRTEPPPDLFVVPSDYTITEAGLGGRGRGGARGPAAEPRP